MIRLAQPGDLDAILKINREGFSRRDDRLTAAWLIRRLAQPGMRLRVDALGLEVRGFILTEHHTGGVYVRMLAVAKEHRQQGVGKGLLSTVAGPAFTKVRRNNYASHRLCVAAGWTAEAEAVYTGREKWTVYTRG